MSRKKFGASLTNAQFKLARAFETAGLTTISQATKAFERHDDEQIEKWKRQLQSRSKPAQEEKQGHE